MDYATETQLRNELSRVWELHDAMKNELTSLRAFKAACEGQDAVHYRAVLEASQQKMNLAPLVAGFAKLTAAQQFVAEKKDFGGWDYAIELLYLHPDPKAAQLRMRIADIERELANERASAIHTCGPDCRRPGCVERLQRDQQVAEACARWCDGYASIYQREMLADTANSFADAIRRGEWKKHMKGGE